MVTEGFIDGDLVERFLDLSQSQMDEVCKGLKVWSRMWIVLLSTKSVGLLHSPLSFIQVKQNPV